MPNVSHVSHAVIIHISYTQEVRNFLLISTVSIFSQSSNTVEEILSYSNASV